MTTPRRKTIVLTGASGGVGRALLDSWRGDDVALWLVAGTRADALRRALADDSASFPNAQVLAADLVQPGAAATLAEKLLEEIRASQNADVPTLDALICAAGVDLMTPESKALDFDARFARAWQIDVASAATLARSLGAVMRDARRANKTLEFAPAILFFGWDGAERGLTGDSGQIYAACKSAVAAFARSLAVTLAPEVRVNTLAPGWIKTTWGDVASLDAVERGAAQSLMRRWGTPREIANVARFLVSSDASYLNGQTIPVNGGFDPDGRRVQPAAH